MKAEEPLPRENTKNAASFPMFLKGKYIYTALFYLITVILVIHYCQNNIHGAADDSYITYRYAQNFIDGNGLVFNVGERYYGSTAMGFALLLGCVTFLIQSLQNLLGVGNEIDIPTVAILASSISLWLIGFCWHNILKRNGLSLFWSVASLAIVIYFFTAHYSTRSPGHETYTYFALLVLSTYLFLYTKRPLSSGIVLALAVMVRPDAFLFAMLLFFASIFDYYYFQRKSPERLKFYTTVAVTFAALLFAWEVFLRIYFGSWMPGTMTAKKAQVLLGHWKLFNIENILAGFQQRTFPGFLFILSFFLGTMAMFALKKVMSNPEQLDAEKKNLFLSAVLWQLFGTGLIMAYSSFHVTLWIWYEIPIYFSLLNAMIASSIIFLKEVNDFFIKNRIAKYIIYALMIALAFPVTVKSYKYIEYRWKTPRINQHTSAYDPIIEYLHENEPDGTSVATAEPGALGYKLGPTYKVIDQLGLISPGVAESIISSDKDYYFETWRPKYIIISWSGKYTPWGQQWFDKNYHLIGEFDHPYWEENVKRGAYLYKLKG